MSQETFSEPTIEELARQVDRAIEAVEEAKAELNKGWTQEREDEHRSRSEAWKKALERYQKKRG